MSQIKIGNENSSKALSKTRNSELHEVEKHIWGIHTLDDDLFLKSKIIAIGWKKMGDLHLLPDNRDSFKEAYQAAYPDAKKGSIPTSSGMLYRFCYEIQIGDYVIYPSKTDRKIYIGQVTGEYKYDSEQPKYVQTRSVEWLKGLPRTAFTQGALYEIGSAMTLFSVKNYAEEFMAALEGRVSRTIPIESDDLTIAETADEIIQSTRDFILKVLSQNLKGYALENFVANLLQAMGYKADVSPQGGDNGIDITAYKDELPPRIVVQVKSQDSDIRETTIQSLKGAMHEGDYGLFVTLSNYTKNAQKYLDSNPIIRGINGSELVDLILKHYDLLDDKYRRMIPLKMVYIPVAVE